MTAPKYVGINTDGSKLETAAAQVAAANSIVATGADGTIDASMIPGEEVVNVLASETINAGGQVNLWNNSGTINARNADATNGRRADGFTILQITSGSSGNVYLGSGRNTGVSGLTVGAIYFLGASGAVTTVVNTTTGQLLQEIGKARSATELDEFIREPVTRA